MNIFLTRPPDSIDYISLSPESAGGFSRLWDKWLEGMPDFIHAIAGLAILLLVALLLFYISRAIVLRLVRAMARRSTSDWDDILVRNGVFERLLWLLPLVVVDLGVAFVPRLGEEVKVFLVRLSLSMMILAAIRVLAALLASVETIYGRSEMAASRPIKGYLQVVMVLAYIVGGVFVLATLIGQSPWYFLSGIGAMTAVILLVFRDTLLSLVASIQMTTNGLVRMGDWIEMPQFGADGAIVDIALNAVTIRNWDNTITAIPTHKFLEHSFKNWRSMSESGGRRIKRSISLDMSTVTFLNDEQVERFADFELLRDYITRKKAELEAYNRVHCRNGRNDVNARRLTNIGTFRFYVVAYLRNHPKIRQDMTFLVRQLEPSAQGVAIEIYAFTNEVGWENYEAIQADIFDHLMAMVPEFGLRVFQYPSGADLAGLSAVVRKPAQP